MLQLKHPQTCKILEINEFWLRDHCRCGECLNTETNQRRLDLFELPPNVTALKHNWVKGEDLEEEQLVVLCKLASI